MKKKQPKYNPGSQYKVTLVLKTGERQTKYFKGEIKLTIGFTKKQINYWFYEETEGELK